MPSGDVLEDGGGQLLIRPRDTAHPPEVELSSGNDLLGLSRAQEYSDAPSEFRCLA